MRWPSGSIAVIGALVLLLAGASVAPARTAGPAGERHHHGGEHGKPGAIVPAPRLLGGLLLREWWEGPLSTPSDDPANPFNAGGCIRRGWVALHYDGACTVPKGTWVFVVGFTTECSDVEEEPYHAETPWQAAKCGLRSDQAATELTLSLDGGAPVDLLSGRFDVFMPWSAVVIPENPIFGGTPGEIMHYGGHGYVALLRSLPVGEHTLLLHIDGEDEPGLDFPIDVESTIIVTPRAHDA